jgi:HJR/Mrr/RecB family endonuclease
MSRRYYKKKKVDSEEKILEIILGLVFIALAYFGFVYSVDRTQFWYEFTHYLLPVLGVIVVLIGAYFVFLSKNKVKEDNRIEELLHSVKETGFESSVISFIDRFGKEGKKESWKYRSYAFDWSRLKDFRDTVIQNNIKVSNEDYQDLLVIIKHYIDNREKDFLNNGILTKTQHRFDELNKEGSDFEHLIVRLYNAMGYVSKRTGGSGDQGADVIASKDGVNVLIQAKCYAGSVSNEAIQQAFAALPYHGCTKAVVITTAAFTTGAIALAKADAVELIDGERLKRLLLEQLGEVWL